MRSRIVRDDGLEIECRGEWWECEDLRFRLEVADPDHIYRVETCFACRGEDHE